MLSVSLYGAPPWHHESISKGTIECGQTSTAAFQHRADDREQLFAVPRLRQQRTVADPLLAPRDVFDVSAGVDDPQRRAELPRLVRQFEPVHIARHDDVGEQDGDVRALPEHFHRVCAARRLQDRVALLAKDRCGDQQFAELSATALLEPSIEVLLAGCGP
jgi:hypothetical protein